MNTVIVPNEISISDIIKRDRSLSPTNYKSNSIINKNQALLCDFLKSSAPYVRGVEPGSKAYVTKSELIFLRNSCIDKLNYNYIKHKVIYLNPNYKLLNMLHESDVLLCKDANIGDACLFVDMPSEKTVFSSGVVKLNFKDDIYKYYCLAFLKDEYFLQQLISKTPKGSTIQHSRDLFLKCKIPLLSSENEEWVYNIMESLIKNIAYSEKECFEKITNINEIIDKELISYDSDYDNPNIQDIIKEARLDAGLFSREVYKFYDNIKKYKEGFSDIETYGFRLKRGPNLAKRDLGRSIITNEFRKNYNTLIYPSDISDSGYILKSSYIGARNPVWFLENKSILFSAEGTVGKTFIICDDTLRFTTNFHGVIIYPKNSDIDIKRSVFVGAFLNYMRIRGILDKISVGAQGGSFATSYWHNILIPNFPDDVIDLITKYYYTSDIINPFVFESDIIKSAGIYELSNLRLICVSILNKLIDDIKKDRLNDIGYYKNYFGKL